MSLFISVSRERNVDMHQRRTMTAATNKQFAEAAKIKTLSCYDKTR